MWKEGGNAEGREGEDMYSGRLVARTVAARAVQRSWRRACQVTRFGQVRLVALGLQAQWRRRAVRAVPSRSAQRALEMQAQAQALVRAQVDNNYKSKTRTRSAEPQNKTFISLPFSSRSRSLLSLINGASSRLPSPPSIVDKDPTTGVWRDAYGHSCRG